MQRNSFWSFLAALTVLTFACRNETTLDAMPDAVEPGDLFKVIQGFPPDTAGGLCGTGRWRPEEGTSKSEGLSRAQQGALGRIFSSLRNQGLPSQVTENRFFNCLDREVQHAYVKMDSLSYGVVEVSVHIPKEFVPPLMACLRQVEE